MNWLTLYLLRPILHCIIIQSCWIWIFTDELNWILVNSWKPFSWQILGSDNGWQSVPLTDLITATAVKKAYRRATLCVHPDKLQQRGATIRQKYICEKVFDLLKVHYLFTSYAYSCGFHLWISTPSYLSAIANFQRSLFIADAWWLSFSLLKVHHICIMDHNFVYLSPCLFIKSTKFFVLVKPRFYQGW